jgi:hypothetical protein
MQEAAPKLVDQILSEIISLPNGQDIPISKCVLFKAPFNKGIIVKINEDAWKDKQVHGILKAVFETYGASEMPAQDAFFLSSNESSPLVNERVERKFILLTELIDGPTPRFDYSTDSLLQLREQMKEMNDPKQLKAIDVKPAKIEGKYVIYDGKRRRTCATSLGWSGLWADIHYGLSDLQAREQSFGLNYGRLGFTELEVGAFFRGLMTDFPDEYPKQQAVADRWKVSQPYVCRVIKDFELHQRLNKINGNTSVVLNSMQNQAVRTLPAEAQVEAAKVIQASDFSQEESFTYVAQVKKDLETTPSFSLEDEPSLEPTHQAAEQQLKAEEIRKTSLKNLLCEHYPDSLVESSVNRYGREMSEAVYSEAFKRIFEALWNRLGSDEQTKFLAGLTEVS